MDSKAIAELFVRVQDGSATEQELAWFNQWYQQYEGKTRVYTQAELEQIREEMHRKLPIQAIVPKQVKLWPRIASIAATVTAIALGIWFFSDLSRSDSKHGAMRYTHDIKPGHNGATLTLANGKKIRLTDAANGQLAEEAGVQVSKSADGELIYEIKEHKLGGSKINMLSTAKGETYKIILPDKSMVWLNASSSLTYYADLAGPETHGTGNAGLVRRVKLEGEAYFEVAKMDRSGRVPFIVESKGQQVKVLGTHFNINSYADEDDVKTTLLEGSVYVAAKLNGQNPKEGGVLLRPNQQAATTSRGIKVKDVDVAIAVAWKDHKFMFESERIENIMKMIARWYNVDVVYKGAVPDDKFGGSVSRFENVAEVLKYLESTGSVHFKIEGRQIIVSK